MIANNTEKKRAADKRLQTAIRTERERMSRGKVREGESCYPERERK